jgi:hypothetical protein
MLVVESRIGSGVNLIPLIVVFAIWGRRSFRIFIFVARLVGRSRRLKDRWER